MKKMPIKSGSTVTPACGGKPDNCAITKRFSLNLMPCAFYFLPFTFYLLPYALRLKP
jgi:hypothetical protein